MSSSDLHRRAVVLGALALPACGFRPLYGGGTEAGPGRLLGQVRIEEDRGELSFRLRESLIAKFRPAAPSAPLILNIEPRVARDGLLIEDDDEITRYNLTLSVAYALRRVGAPTTDPALASGEARTVAAFNATASQYATLVSEREVRARAADDVADKIARRIAAAFDPAWLE